MTVVKGLWVCEGQLVREGMDAEVCMCGSSKAVPHDWCGSVCKRRRDLCACEERRGTREIIRVCVYVCVYMHEGFSSFCMHSFKKGGFKGAFQQNISRIKGQHPFGFTIFLEGT